MKAVLRSLGLYYSLQGIYRSVIHYFKKLSVQRSYKKYKGHGFQCNACGAVYKKFVPRLATGNIVAPLTKNKVIAGYGDNIFCPDCFSTSRDRLVLAILKDNVQVDKKQVLHMSPEASISKYLRSVANVVSTDVEPGFYKKIDKTTIYADISHLPFPDNHFDLIIANHILEHIPDDLHAMKELLRVLKTGGKAILQVPFSKVIVETLELPDIKDPAMQAKLFGQKDHVRIYSADDYVKRLQSTGFVVTVLDKNDLAKYKKYAIQEEELVFMVSKSQ